jgi:hypothetical protein
VVKGLNLITLYYTDPNGVSVRVNYRINDKTDGKTKHDYFRDMLFEVIGWGYKELTQTCQTVFLDSPLRTKSFSWTV